MSRGSAPASTAARPATPADSYRAALRWLAASRVAVAMVLLAFVPLQDAGRFAAELADPAMFERVAVVYLLVAILYLSTAHRFHDRFDAMLVVHALTDLFALSMLMHAAGDLRSGVVVLLIAALAGAAVVSTRRMAASFAAVATLLVLGEATWPVLHGASEAGLTITAGLVGLACFATAMTVNWLAIRLHAQEDIARRRGEDLRRQLAVTSQVVAELQQGVLVVGADGAVTTMNPAARALLGVRAEAPTLGGAGRGDGGPGWAALGRAYAHWREGGAARHVESEIDLPAPGDGTARIRLRFLGSGEPGGDAVVILEDQRLIEERAQQLKLASMGRLSASIAHEVRNPLAAIRHANSLLAERLADPALARLARIVEDNTVRIDRIVGDVLSIARRERAAQYDEALADLPIDLPPRTPWAESNRHLYPIRTSDRDALQAHLRDAGIQTLIHYPVPVHLQPAYAGLGYGPGAFPRAEAACARVLSLPLYPELPADHQDRVIAALRQFFA
ncbi:MAG: DegT/DnrJ/EryC1/StrS family aminotransferase [Burkholderiaceae bacterium]|nr:DegT/DnrJ/EryC1/StrS family aminotransferase [Burkholderiaceae bacterium]